MHRRVSKAGPGVADDIGVRISPQVPAANCPVQQMRLGAATRTSKMPQATVATLQEIAGPLTRSDSLRFAPSFSTCHVLNVQ